MSRFEFHETLLRVLFSTVSLCVEEGESARISKG